MVRAAVKGLVALMVSPTAAAYLGPKANRFFAKATPWDLRAVGFGISMRVWRLTPGEFGALKLLQPGHPPGPSLLRWLTSVRPTP